MKRLVIWINSWRCVGNMIAHDPWAVRAYPDFWGARCVIPSTCCSSRSLRPLWNRVTTVNHHAGQNGPTLSQAHKTF